MQIHISSGMHPCSVEDIKLDFIQEASRGRDTDTLVPYFSVSLKGSGTKEEEYRALLMINLDELLKVMNGLKEVQSELYASYLFVKVNKLWGEFLKGKRERERESERKASENKPGEGDAAVAAHTTTPVMITRPRAESVKNAIICALCGERFATGEALDNHMWCIHRDREKPGEPAWSSTD
jgi:hypothetical protein